jgi:hypothetical protein
MGVGWASAWAAAPFSHRVHLQLKLECATCHSEAATSTKPSDNLLPSRDLCQSCHKNPEIPPPATTRLVHFSHAQHLKMGNISALIANAIDRGTYLQPAGDIRRNLSSNNLCFGCHRGIAESDRVSKANLPQMADCLVCHTKIEPPFSCAECHAKTEDLRAASHQAKDFADSHSNHQLMPDKSSCAVCHGKGFTCMGCH